MPGLGRSVQEEGPSADIVVRAAGYDETALLAELHRSAFETGPPGQETWSPEVMEQLLRMPGSEALIAELEGQAQGMLLFRLAADEGEILTLAVAPAARRNGCATALMGAAVGLFTGLGIKSLFLEVAEDNTAALALYTALGFARAGHRKAYYTRSGGATADALILTRTDKN